MSCIFGYFHSDKRAVKPRQSLPRFPAKQGIVVANKKLIK